MQRTWTIEALGSHDFLVHGDEHGDPVDVQVTLHTDTLEDLGLTDIPDEQVVDGTVAFLLEHQRLDDLPAEVELEAVAAAYDNFADWLRGRLAP